MDPQTTARAWTKPQWLKHGGASCAKRPFGFLHRGSFASWTKRKNSEKHWQYFLSLAVAHTQPPSNDPLTCTLWVFARAPAAPGAAGVSQCDTREPKRAFWVVHGLETPPRFNEKTPGEGKQSESLGGRGETKSDILGGLPKVGSTDTTHNTPFVFFFWEEGRREGRGREETKCSLPPPPGEGREGE